MDYRTEDRGKEQGVINRMGFCKWAVKQRLVGDSKGEKTLLRDTEDWHLWRTMIAHTLKGCGKKKRKQSGCRRRAKNKILKIEKGEN